MTFRIPPPVVFIAFAVIMYYLPPMMTFSSSPYISLSFILVGGFIAILSLWQFYQFDTTIDPRHPEKTKAFVKTGIYRLSRNPMYLSLAFFLSAWAFWLQSLGAFLGVVGFIYWITYFQIRYEEAWMEKHFGQAYSRYKKRTRCWL